MAKKKTPQEPEPTAEEQLLMAAHRRAFREAMEQIHPGLDFYLVGSPMEPYGVAGARRPLTPEELEAYDLPDDAEAERIRQLAADVQSQPPKGPPPPGWEEEV